MTRQFPWAFTLVLWCIAADHAIADGPVAANSEPEFLERQVRVLDPEMHPIEGAVVIPDGFRTRVERGSFWGWYEPSHGPQPEATTGADGIATLRIPKHATEELEIGEAHWFVDHHDFVTYRKDHPIDEDPTVAVLSHGYRIAATVVDAQGEPVQQHLFATLGGGGWPRADEWTVSDKGILVSRVFGRERSTLRIIQLNPDEPARFSDLLNIESPDGDRVFLKGVTLHRGVRVVGTLAGNVPRPVRNGRVSAYISAAPANREMTDRSQLWRWNDVASIKADGSFVFESLPTGEALQLVVLCDGWISRNPTEDELKSNAPWHTDGINDGSTTPQVFTLEGAEIRPVVQMEQTATCVITVLKPDGTPLENATVSMWPNHSWLRGGSTLLGFGFRSTDLIQGIRRGDNKMLWKYGQRFSCDTNAEGVATIDNLHGRASGADVTHADYQQAISGNMRSTTISLKPGQTQTDTIRMQANGTDVLGR